MLLQALCSILYPLVNSNCAPLLCFFKSEGFDSCDRPSNLKLDSNRQVFRLVLKRVWRDIRDSHNGGHCLLTVGGRLRRVKIGGECVKYAWLSCPARPSRWVLCISMQWLTLKGCHVPCDECASGEICSHQHMWVTGLSYGSREWRVTKIWGPRCKRD